jgi:hypothetical protein
MQQGQGQKTTDCGYPGYEAASPNKVHSCWHCRGIVVGGIRRQPNGRIDYRDDFFGKPAYLTVSGQLQVGEGGREGAGPQVAGVIAAAAAAAVRVEAGWKAGPMG